MGVWDIDVSEYEDLHEDSGYGLAATAEVLVPWFRCALKCRCESEQPMSELDKFVCRCMERGIDTPKDIAFALSLDDGIMDGEVEKLVAQKILQFADERLIFTEAGWDCFTRKICLEVETKEFPVSMNAITGAWTMGEETLLSNNAPQESALLLSPMKTAMADDIEYDERIRKQLETKHTTHILQLKLMDYMVVAYQSRAILFYQNKEKKVLFEVLDAETGSLDIELSSALRKRYEKKEILELVRAEKYLADADSALVRQNSALRCQIERQIKQEYPAADVRKAPVFREMQNREIRELFLQKLDTAKKHLFIISPWISDFVVNEQMVKRLESALMRGVRVDIGFGYVSYEKLEKRISNYKREIESAGNAAKRESIERSREKEDKNYHTWKMARMLKRRLGKHSHFRIFYMREGTHEKIFCCDDTHTLMGSFNLLSYDGGEQEGYSGLHFRKECAVFIEDEVFASGVMRKREASAKLDF